MKDAFLLPCSFADLEIRYQHIPAYRYQEATNHTSNAMDQDHLVAALAQWGRQWERPPKVVTGKPGRPPKKSKVVEKKRSDKTREADPTSLFYIYVMATSFFFICVMTTSFLFIYVMATSLLFVYYYISYYPVGRTPKVTSGKGSNNDFLFVDFVGFGCQLIYLYLLLRYTFYLWM